MKKLLILSALAVALSQPASALNVSIYGESGGSAMAAFLNANGHTTTFSGVVPTAGQLAGVNVVVAVRRAINADIVNFVNAGGLLITEWDASISALNTFSLIQANDGGGGFVGTNTAITLTAQGLAAGLTSGQGGIYQDQEATEFFRTLTNIGGGVEILGTRSGNLPAIIGGASGAGDVLVFANDFQDGFNSVRPSAVMLLSAVNYQGGLHGDPVPDSGSSLTLAALGLGLLVAFRRFARR